MHETVTSIQRKNASDTWRNCISYTIEYPKKDNERYTLYPTGNCDLNGRKYVAIPSHVHILSEGIKKKYHILEGFV
jgi:hypothetical protein